MKYFQPNRLTEEREAANLTMEKLASLVEISKQAISKIEKKELKPSPATLANIAFVLNKDVDYFFDSFNHNRILDISFRSSQEQAAYLLEEIEVTSTEKIDKILQIESILDIDLKFEDPLADFDEEITSLEIIEKVAMHVRQKWELGSSPIFNVTELLEKKGIYIAQLNNNYDFDGISGKYLLKPIIILNQKVSEVTRVRFTLLHELGHILLNNRISPELKASSIEEICNRFAGAFLLPRTALDDFFRNRNSFTMSDFINLKETYGVSIKAIWVRARVTNHITSSTYYKWSESYSLQTDFGKFTGVEKPTKLENLLSQAVSEAKMTIQEAVEYASDINNYLFMDPKFKID